MESQRKDRLGLKIHRYESQDLANLIHGYETMRLEAYLSLAKDNGEATDPELAYIDTGAGISVIPPRIWKTALIESLGPYSASGLNVNTECKVETQVAYVHGFLSDDSFHQTKVIRFPALLTGENVEKVCIGFRGLLERYTLVYDNEFSSAYLEGEILDLKQKAPSG